MTTLFFGDMIEKLNEVPDKSVRLFILDLPYNQTDLTFDKNVIPLDKLWIQLLRCGLHNCCYIFFCTTKFGYKLIQSNEKLFRYDLVWNKNACVGFLNCKKQPLRTHEMIYVFYEKQPFYNLSSHIKTCNAKNIIEYTSESIYGTKTYFQHRNSYEPKLPVSILNYSTEKYKKNRLHPTEKPIELYKYLINHYSDENEIICDPCFGSGNSLVASIETGRKYFGIEHDPIYFQKAELLVPLHIKQT
jgi:site-specific DNA-methyltransferase (adenine-specific)